MLTCVPLNAAQAIQLHVKKTYFQTVKLLSLKQQTSRALEGLVDQSSSLKTFLRDHWIVCLDIITC